MRGPRTVARAGLLLVGLAALPGCPRVPPAGLARDPSALLDQVRAGQGRVQRVRGSARVKIASPGLSGTVTEFAAAEKPDRLHLETIDFFGSPAAVMVAAEGRFTFLDVKANVFYRGDATPENVSRLLPVAIPVEELVTILCGSAPLLPGTPLEVGAQDGLVLLTIGLGDVGQRVALGEQASVVWSRIRRAASGGDPAREESPAYDLAFGQFRGLAGVRFPGTFHLDAPSGQAQVDLSWNDDLEVNGAVAPTLYRLGAPRGARVVELRPGEAIPAAPPLPVRE